jgi:hypothetical protein
LAAPLNLDPQSIQIIGTDLETKRSLGWRFLGCEQKQAGPAL